MKNLLSRTVSAIVALCILFFAIYYGREQGIYFLAILVVLRGSFEVARLFFNKNYPKYVKTFLIFLSGSTFLITTQENLQFLSGITIIFCFISIVCIGILFHKQFQNLEQILSFIAKTCLGVIYTSFLPATVIWIIQTNNGIEWFLCLLAVVFSGDIGAYIFGVNFGKTKIAPSLSPNKSLQGALGGLLFSIITSILFQLALPNTPLFALVLCGFFGGFFGQIGDLFESLIKRISGVKDSGSIMPGHGGVLDRLDGVLLSAPLFYLAAKYFSL